jgi:G3E family GTPase
MIGGFLGAGKSTAVLALARHLDKLGKKVGLITNDQSVGLVDTAMMKSAGFAVEEIPGGCFCCRFNSLVEAADRLAAENTPEVFIAEPVGSCTDLVASVSYPLRRIYGDKYEIAPLSVLVDPVRAARVLGLETGQSFSEKVIYVYRKQLEEADIIVINKLDTLPPEALARLKSELEKQFPNAKVIAVSARHGHGLTEWFKLLETTAASNRRTMAIDYDVYADGEALLGWLNATVNVAANKPFDGETLMMDLAERIRGDLGVTNGEVAHLKMTMMPEDHGGHIAVLNLVRNDFVPELAQSLPEQMRRGQLIVNLRAECAPEQLMAITTGAIAAEAARRPGVKLTIEHAEHFRPGRPNPTWRMPDADTLTNLAGN